MATYLHIDIETYSSIDIKSQGAYRYCDSIDFEILLIAYSINDGEIKVIDLAQGEKITEEFLKYYHNPDVIKTAHNANFERICFRAAGLERPIQEWECTAVKSAYCGLPLSLEMVSKALNLGSKGKKATGKQLINYFCVPQKITKSNTQSRNFPEDNLDKWKEFIDYCVYDVIAEREIHKILKPYDITLFEQYNYIIDQQINDRGIKIDKVMAQRLYDLDNLHSQNLLSDMREITGVENPNSTAQLKEWLTNAMGREVKTLAKDNLAKLEKEAESDAVSEVIDLRRRTSKTSTKKYAAMLNCVCSDDRVHGLFQFYGANRTGRWAGRLVQLQNLTKNYITGDPLTLARETLKGGDYDLIKMMYDNVSGMLSQLIRTAFIAEEGHMFLVSDFAAIEARVVAWLADERWRLDVFADHGKIYEASASKMFNVPIEQVTKGSDLRAKGKNAELALGYQGSVGAMLRLGADKMGMSEKEMLTIVKKWRKSNPAIVKFWYDCEKYAKLAMQHKRLVKTNYRGIAFSYDGNILQTHLPSGRRLSYFRPRIKNNKYGTPAIQYLGMDQVTKKWVYIDTYGGKLVENIVQAVSRDILAYSMQRLNEEGFTIVMHVHDEIICEMPKENAIESLHEMEKIMCETIPWAEGLPLAADGYVTPYYKKDD